MSENGITYEQRSRALKLSDWRYWGVVCVIAAVYFGAAKFGLSLAFVNSQVTAIWPPTGIALVTLLLLGNRMWPGIFLGAFLINAITGTPMTAVGLAIGNTLEAVVGRIFSGGTYGIGRALQCSAARDAPHCFDPGNNKLQ